MGRGEGERLGEAALALVSAPFRMHGRNAETGLDCVGVAVAALALTGRVVAPPANYRLRGGCLDRFDQWAAECGLQAVASRQLSAPGDVLLCAPAPHQYHVMIDAGQVLVHAHAGLRRVVAEPPLVTWPVVRRWRLDGRS